MNKRKYDVVTYIGRFEPAHIAHIQTVMDALDISDKVIILVGSANQPRTIKNPWVWHERGDMIYASLPKAVRERVIVLPVRDIMYNDPAWVAQIQEVVSPHIHDDGKNGIIGYSKDETSYYLKMFPQWEQIEVDNIDDLHATDIRTAMYENKNFDTEVGQYLPVAIHDYIKSFMLTREYDQLVREYEFQMYHDRSWDMVKMLNYFMQKELHTFEESQRDTVRQVIERLQKDYLVAKYEPMFVTTDIIIVQAGHVLVVRRRAEPGRGLYAFPGGYLEAKEWSVDGGLRELKEETGIKVPPAILRSNIKADHWFEHPERSLRGRIITHAMIIELPAGGDLPKVKGSNETDKVKWIPISVFRKMEEQMFEDHFHIFNNMLARL